MKWTRKHAIVAGIALIAVTNAIALLGITYNRGGAPESTLRFSQRELQPSHSRASRENSGLALRIRWRVLEEVADPNARWQGGGGGGSPQWLDRDKMAALGFDVSVPDNPDDHARTFRRQLARDVLLVLEMDGPTYQRALVNADAAAERMKANSSPESTRLAGEMLQYERELNSRLFVVDASLDAAALRSKYPDRSRHAIVRGRVEPTRKHLAGNHAGSVSGLAIDEIHVPLALRPAFEGAVPELMFAAPDTRMAAYSAIVNFGRRLEPWFATAAKGRG